MTSPIFFQDEILNSISEGLFTVNKEFRINFFNKSAARLTGYDKNEVVDKFCKNVFCSDLCKGNCPLVKVLQSGEELNNLETVIVKKSGEKLLVKLNAAVLRNEANEPVGGVVSFREIFCQETISEYIKKNAHYYGIIGFSKPMTDIFNLINEVADCDATILIQGETGTGKELLADAIHATSRRKESPFIKVNCSALPDNLLISELFGHVKGAFTSAVKDRVGRFELADKGTIFLDEIAEISPQTQLQLLRILQHGTFERLGESTTRKVDVRVIAATNKDIEAAIANGKFREDLYYRLNVIPIKLPPLRERKDDIIFLVKYFLKRFSLIYSKEITEIDDDALDLVMKFTWPGNIRQMENALEFAFIRTKPGQSICVSKLPEFLRETIKNSSPNVNYKNEVSDDELIKVLEKYRWNKTKAAEELGLNRTTIWRRLKTLGIEN